MKVISIILLVGLAVSFSAAAQSNEVIDQVLDQNELVYKNGAYFVLTASGIVPETTEPEEAFTALLEKQSEWKLKNPRPEQKMRLGDFSHILMRALDIPGGLL